MPLKLRVGTKGVSSIAGGTHLTNDQLFTDISVSDLCKYRDAGLKIIKGVITIEAGWTCTMELDTVKLTVAGVANDEIKVEASPSSRSSSSLLSPYPPPHLLQSLPNLLPLHASSP